MAECWETAASWPSHSGSDSEVCALYCTKWPLRSQEIHLAPVVKNPGSGAKPLSAVAISTTSRFWDLGQVLLVCLCLSFHSCKMGTMTIVTPSDSWEWDHTQTQGKAAQHPHTCSVHVPVCCYLQPPCSRRTNQPCVFPWAVCVPSASGLWDSLMHIMTMDVIFQVPVWNFNLICWYLVYFSCSSCKISYGWKYSLSLTFYFILEYSWLTTLS